MPLLALGLMCSARSAEAYTVQTDSLTTDSVAVQLPADSVEAPKHFYEKGFIGIFLGGFKNCALGLSAALVFSYIASLICQPKMKKH